MLWLSLWHVDSWFVRWDRVKPYAFYSISLEVCPVALFGSVLAVSSIREWQARVGGVVLTWPIDCFNSCVNGGDSVVVDGGRLRISVLCML